MRTLAAVIALNSFASKASDLNIKARDHLTFNLKDNTCHAQGNVFIHKGTNSIRSDDAFVRLQKNGKKHRIRSLSASGHIFITLSEGTIIGNKASYHADQKRATIKGGVRFDGNNAVVLSNCLNLFFTNEVQEKKSVPRLHSIYSPYPVCFQNKDILAKSQTGAYNDCQKKAIICGKVHIWHKKNYIAATKTIVDLKKKCYFVTGNQARCLIHTQKNNIGRKEKNGSCRN